MIYQSWTISHPHRVIGMLWHMERQDWCLQHVSPGVAHKGSSLSCPRSRLRPAPPSPREGSRRGGSDERLADRDRRAESGWQDHGDSAQHSDVGNGVDVGNNVLVTVLATIEHDRLRVPFTPKKGVTRHHGYLKLDHNDRVCRTFTDTCTEATSISSRTQSSTSEIVPETS